MTNTSVSEIRSTHMGVDKVRSDFLGSPDESMPDRYSKDPE
jgi:hypothetical protein